MKKYYGPIVLGLAALTLGAATTQTTVHAEDNSSEGTQVETPAQSEGTEDKGEQTGTSVESDIQKELNQEIASIDDMISSGNYKAEQITTLKNAKEEYTKKAAAAKNDQDRQAIYDDLDSSIVNNDNIAYTVELPTNAIVSGTKEKVAIPAKSVVVYAGETQTNYVELPNGYAPVSQPKGISAEVKVSVSNDGKVTFSGDVDKNNNLTVVDTITPASLKKDIDEDLYLSTVYTSSDKKDELAKLNNSYKQELTAIQNKVSAENVDAKTLHTLSDEAKSVVDKYTNDITLSETTAQFGVPALKGGSVTFRFRNEFITVKYNEDATKLVSAEVTDKNGNKVKSNTKLIASVGLSSFNGPDSVKNTNEPLSGTNTNTNNSSNNNSTKPDTNTNTETTPNKSVSDHVTTFYVLPNNPVTLFDGNGSKLTNRVLGGNSLWRADKLMSLDGVNYLRVATNEWVKLDNGLEVNPLKQTITTNKQAHLYTGKGKLITNRVLGNNTAWLTDQSATIDGQTMYRVATNEWLSANDIK